MSIRPIIAGVALVLLLVLAVVLLTDSTLSPRSSSPGKGTQPRVPRGPRLSARQIDRQDRITKRQARREARVFDQRPLLDALPTVRQGVSFDIGGLGRDGRKTVILIDAKGQGRRRALIAYRALRRETGDRSRGYQLEVRP